VRYTTRGDNSVDSKQRYTATWSTQNGFVRFSGRFSLHTCKKRLRLRVGFCSKSRHHRSFRRPRFLVRQEYFGYRGTLLEVLLCWAPFILSYLKPIRRLDYGRRWAPGPHCSVGPLPYTLVRLITWVVHSSLVVKTSSTKTKTKTKTGKWNIKQIHIAQKGAVSGPETVLKRNEVFKKNCDLCLLLPCAKREDYNFTTHTCEQIIDRSRKQPIPIFQDNDQDQ